MAAILFFSKWFPYGFLEHCSNMPAGVGLFQSDKKVESLSARTVHFVFIWLWFDSNSIAFQLIRF